MKYEVEKIEKSDEDKLYQYNLLALTAQIYANEHEENPNSDSSEYVRSVSLEDGQALGGHISQQNGLRDDQKDALNANLKAFHQEQNS